MTAPLLTAAMEATRGLPHLARVLFFELLARADLANGTIGLTTRVSYQALKEAAFVERGRGRTSDDCGSPSRERIRSALRTLINEGHLIERGQLVFEAPILTQGYCAQNKLTTFWPHTDQSVSPPKHQNHNGFKVIDGGKLTANWPRTVHTSIDDDVDDDGGFDKQSTEHLRERLTSTQLARQFVNSRGFNPTSLTPDCMACLKQWEQQGVTQGVFLHVVELVDTRLARKGLGRPNSPKYYHQEMMKALSNADSRRAGEAGSH